MGIISSARILDHELDKVIFIDFCLQTRERDSKNEIVLSRHIFEKIELKGAENMTIFIFLS